nr:hypothetical protein [Chryseobacterium sp. MMS21-Ot14]
MLKKSCTIYLSHASGNHQRRTRRLSDLRNGPGENT